MNVYIFFEEDNPEEILYEVQAKDYDDAFDKAFDDMGPQVQDWYYKLKE